MKYWNTICNLLLNLIYFIQFISLRNELVFTRSSKYTNLLFERQKKLNIKTIVSNSIAYNSFWLNVYKLLKVILKLKKAIRTLVKLSMVYGKFQVNMYYIVTLTLQCRYCTCDGGEEDTFLCNTIVTSEVGIDRLFLICRSKFCECQLFSSLCANFWSCHLKSFVHSFSIIWARWRGFVGSFASTAPLYSEIIFHLISDMEKLISFLKRSNISGTLWSSEVLFKQELSIWKFERHY